MAVLEKLVIYVKLPVGLSGPMRTFWLDKFNKDAISLQGFVDAVRPLS